MQLFTDSPPVPPCERRQTRVSYEQNGYLVCRRNEQRIAQIIKQAVPEIHEVTKFGLEVLTGKALSVSLEFIDETDEKVFCFVFKPCVTLFSLHVHK